MPASLYAKREYRHGVLETIRHIFGYFIQGIILQLEEAYRSRNGISNEGKQYC